MITGSKDMGLRCFELFTKTLAHVFVIAHEMIWLQDGKNSNGMSEVFYTFIVSTIKSQD